MVVGVQDSRCEWAIRRGHPETSVDSFGDLLMDPGEFGHGESVSETCRKWPCVETTRARAKTTLMHCILLYGRDRVRCQSTVSPNRRCYSVQVSRVFMDAWLYMAVARGKGVILLTLSRLVRQCHIDETVIYVQYRTS